MKNINLLIINIILSYCILSAADILEQSFYGKLNVPINVSALSLDRAFRKKALMVHPDKTKNKDTTAQFQELLYIYHILKDPEQRNAYNKQLAIELSQSKSSFAQHIAQQLTYDDDWIQKLFFVCSRNCSEP